MARAVRVVLMVLAAALALFAIGCKEDPPKKLAPSTLTSAELRTVRRGVTVVHRGDSEREPYARERLGDGAEVRIAAGGLAWLRRDGGTTLLVRGPGKVLLEDDTLRVESGKVFAETPAGQTEMIKVPEGSLVLSAVRASLDIVAGKTDAYILEGEIRAEPVVARAGELLHLNGGKPTVEPALSWEDWTGGLATTDPTSEPAPFGVGTVGARRPGSTGTPHSPLTIQRLDVRVRVEGDLAITEVDETFFNPESETVEGIYRFRVPEGALLERFGVDRDGGILYGYVKEKAAAQAQYQSHVYKGSTEDPALLAWTAPNVYEARLYPIGPGETRRVVVRYTEWLTRSGAKGERRMYVYPMAFEGNEDSAPQIEDLSIEVDIAKANAKSVRSASEALRAGDVIVVRDHDMVPRSDFALELYDDGVDVAQAVRTRHTSDLVALGESEKSDARRKGDGEADYILVPIRPTDIPKPEEGLDLIVVVDTSAATDRAMLRLARATTRALLAHLGDNDRALVLAGDDRLRPVVASQVELVKADAAMKAKALEGLAAIEPGGASDLAALLSDATTKVGDKRASAIVYVGDGVATVGETDLAAIRDRLKKAPRLVRTFALGIGDAANMAMLSGLSTGGFAERVTDDRAAARASLRLLEVAERSVDLGATLDLGANVERVYPRELGAVTSGETVMVVGRITNPSPTEATLKTVRGSSTFGLSVKTQDDHGDLRRRWAMGRLDELISTAAGHAALVDLGVRQGIITPVTSIYVPTTAEMTPSQRASIDRTQRKRLKLDLGKLEDSKTADAGSDDDRGGQKSKNKSANAAPSSAPEAAASAAATADVGVAKRTERRFESQANINVDDLTESKDAQKEGGSGTRAKGEEGEMGDREGRRDQRENTAQELLPDAPAAGYGRAAGDGDKDTPSPTATAAPADPMAAAPPLASASASPPTSTPPSAAGNGQPGTGSDHNYQSNRPKLVTDKTPDVAGVNAPAAYEPTKAEPARTEGVVAQGLIDTANTNVLRVTVTIDDPGRVRRKCGRGADLPFAERKNLWRERLSTANANPRAIHQIYKQALAWCEAPTMRERRSLLILSLDYLPSVSSQVVLHRLLSKDVQAADVVYRGILARVTTPDQVRELNAALGLLTIDPQTLETTIKEAKSPAELVTKLRQLKTKFPDDLTLALRLLDALEDVNDASAARLLARDLRQRSDADTRVRTSVGELHLRLAAKASSPEQKQSDEDEAKRAFGEIVEFAPEDPVARRRLGDLYRAHAYYAEAARQYETLARLIPDDPTAMVLQAASANGLGKLEEAVRWLEKGGEAGAPDVAQGPHATAQAFAALFIGWGRAEAKAAGRTDEWKALGTRLDKVQGSDKREGQVRVLLSWSHPELHPTLWTNALGTMMPASEGDVTLGLTQAMMVDRSGATIEIRVEPSELEHAARLGAKATLTVVYGEGKDTEIIDRREVSFAKDAPVQRFGVSGAKVEQQVVEQAPAVPVKP